MQSGIWLRVAILAAPPMLLWAWLLTPALQPQPQRATGAVQAAEACLLYCQPTVAVSDLRLSCQADLVGLPQKCGSALLAPGFGAAVYARVPTLTGLLGLAPTDGVLLELERDGQVVFKRSLRSQVLAGLYGSWGFHALYWPIVGFIIWRWPHSRVSRRAQWLPPKGEA